MIPSPSDIVYTTKYKLQETVCQYVILNAIYVNADYVFEVANAKLEQRLRN